MFEEDPQNAGTFVANLPVSFHDDESWREILDRLRVTLLNEWLVVRQNYRVNTDGTQDATVKIWDDDAPVLSIGDVTRSR